MCFLLLSLLADTLLQNEVFAFPFFLQLAKCKTSSLRLAFREEIPLLSPQISVCSLSVAFTVLWKSHCYCEEMEKLLILV